jgi:hypothetical protein
MNMALNCCKDLHCPDPSAGGSPGILNGFELGFCSLDGLRWPVPVPDSALCRLTANVWTNSSPVRESVWTSE